MSVRDRLTLVAALAVALAASALGPVYDGLGWLPRVLGVVAVVAVTGLVARRLALPGLLQPAAQAVAVAAYCAVVFARDTLALGLVPSGATGTRLRALVETGLLDVEALAPPVPSTPGLVLLAVLGVGAIAVVVDLVAVGLGRAAAAGLPLLLLFAVPSAVLADGLGWLPFVLGASGWLALLLVEGDDRVGRWGTPLRSAAEAGEDASLGRVGRRIGAAALGVAVLVPAGLPGLDTRLLDGGTGEGLGGKGAGKRSTTYNPITRLQGLLTLPDPQRLFSYSTSDPTPDYVRMTTLDTYRDGQWSASELRGDPEDDAVDDGIPEPAGVSGEGTQEHSLRLAIDGLGVPWLPLPATPTDVDVPGRWVWDDDAQTVFSAQDDTSDLRGKSFEARFRTVEVSADDLGGVGRVPDAVAPYVQQVPLTPRVSQTLGEVVGDAGSDFEQVLAIQDFLRDAGRGFVYDTRAEPPPAGQDPLDHFLTARRGFCEQYASAMAALVRALGLPARVAVGFTPGRRDDKGFLVVTTNEAHAWPEVWFQGVGWVRFEPTPRTDATSVPDYATTEEAEPGPAPSGGPQPSAEPSTGPSATPGPDDPRFREEQEANDPAALDDPAAGSGSGAPPLPVVVALAALLAASVPALVSLLRRRHRGRQLGALVAWAQLRDDASDVGHTWRPADSPRTAARRLVADRGLPAPAAEAVHRLASAVERVRYARPDGSGSGAGAGSGSGPGSHAADVAAVRSALLATSPRSTRWRARLLPPSTVRWGSHLLGERIADVLDRLDDAVSAVGRRLRLRPRTG